MNEHLYSGISRHDTTNNALAEMKPFNLKEALAGKPVVTRLGYKVVYIHNTAQEGVIMPIVYRIEGDRHLRSSLIDGKLSTDYTTYSDLFMAKTKVTKWVNIFSSYTSGEVTSGKLYDDETDARRDGQANGGTKYLTTVPVTYEV